MTLRPSFDQHQYEDYDSLPYVAAEPVSVPPSPRADQLPYVEAMPLTPPPKRYSGPGVAAFVSSLFAIVLNWLIFFPPPINLIFFGIVIILALSGFAFGWMTANGLVSASGKSAAKDRYGFLGLTLSLAAIILSTAWVTLSTVVMWGVKF